jgi:aminoglycoside phosphotransferase (APT) family kinase protein
MNDPLLGAKLRSILDAVRADLRPELTGANARLRCDLIEMLLARLSVEADAPDLPEGADEAARLARNAVEDAILAVLAAPVEIQGSRAELVIAPETFTRWLAARGIAGTVRKVTTVPGGRSKGTLLLDVEGGRDLVIRLDFSASTTGTSVIDEYPVIAAVHGAGLRVPHPLGVESAPEVIGGRFIAFERIAGRAMGTLFASDASPAFCRELAGELARLHRLDPVVLGLADTLPYGRAEDPVRALVDRHEADYRRTMAAEPLIDTAFAWLRAQLPVVGIQRHLVHGDCGLHNTMGDGDRLTGLLDWEFAHCGDPAEDLAYCRFLVAQRLPWDDFMAAYRDAGGPVIAPERLRFFTVWRTLILSIWTGGTRGTYDRGADRDLRLAAIAHNTYPRQLRALANDLAQAIAAQEIPA